MNPSRRRFLTISAASIAAISLPLIGAKKTMWRGKALGADVSIEIRGNTQDTKIAMTAAIDTIRRMENLFSLYAPNSALSLLNRNGALNMPPEFARLISQVHETHYATEGLFDPTIQPIFAALLKGNNETDGALRESAKTRTGWKYVALSGNEIRFSKNGMALTLNGIAQGFATDRVSEVLKSHGLGEILVNVGEYRAAGEAAHISVHNTKGEALSQIKLRDEAVATSSPSAFRFPNGAGHMISPRQGFYLENWKTVSVTAPTATMADGISTALCLTRDTRLARKLLEKGTVNSVLLENNSGEVVIL